MLQQTQTFRLLLFKGAPVTPESSLPLTRLFAYLLGQYKYSVNKKYDIIHLLDRPESDIKFVAQIKANEERNETSLNLHNNRGKDKKRNYTYQLVQ